MGHGHGFLIPRDKPIRAADYAGQKALPPGPGRGPGPDVHEDAVRAIRNGNRTRDQQKHFLSLRDRRDRRPLCVPTVSAALSHGCWKVIIGAVGLPPGNRWKLWFL